MSGVVFNINRCFFSILTIVSVLFYGATTKTSAQPVRHPTSYFKPTDYNAGLHNYCFAQDKRGLIYVGNEDCVLEYDGAYWKKIPVKKGCNIYSIVVDTSNRIYVGGNNEFGMISPNSTGNLAYQSLSDKLISQHKNFGNVLGIYPARNGMYFVTSKTIFLWTGKSFIIIWPDKEIKESFYINRQLFVHYNNDGLYLLEGSSLKTFISSDIFAGNNFVSLLPFRKQQYIVLTKDKGFFIYRYDEILESGNDNVFSKTLIKTNTNIDDYLIKSQPYGAKLIDNDRIAVYTNLGGVFLFDRNFHLITIINKSKGLKFNRVRSVFADRSDFLWMGLENGINRIEYKSKFSVYDENVGLNGNALSAIRYNGKLVVGTTNGVHVQKVFTSIYESETANAIFMACDNLSSAAYSFFIADNKLYAVTSDGIYWIDADHLNSILVLPGDFSVFEWLDKQKKLLIFGGRDGLKVFRAANGRFDMVKKFDGVPEDITSLAVIKTAINDVVEIWTGTKYNGVLRLITNLTNNESLIKYARTKGISEGGCFVENYKNSVLVGSSRGLLTYNVQRDIFIKDYDFGSSLAAPSNEVTYIKNHSEDSVWFISSHNHDVVPGLCAKGKYSKKYAYEENLFSSINIGKINDILPDSNVVWFAGFDGLLSFNSSLYEKSQNNIHVLIRKVIVNHDSVIHGGTYANSLGNYSSHQTEAFIHTLPHKYNSLTFEFSAVNVHNASKILYSYFLEGYDSKWSPATPTNRKEFTNLPKGHYKFHVIAISSTGVQSKVATYEFKVLPAWYFTTSAYVAYVIILIGVIVLVNFISVKRLNRAKQRLEKMVKERTYEVLIKNKELEEQRNEIEQKNKDLTDSITYAQRIQQSMLPEYIEIKKHIPDHFILFKPRDIVSGDFYWFAEQNYKGQQIVYIAAVDCTGHGVSGAMMSMVGNSILNEILNVDHVLQPAAILNQLDKKLRNYLKQGKEDALSRDGMDIALCSVNLSTRHLTFAGALRTCFIGRNFKITELPGNKFPIGGMLIDEVKEFAEQHFTLEPNDSIYLFSDGYPSQFGGEKGKKFGTKRFKNVLEAILGMSLNDQKMELLLELEDWQGEMDQVDDILVIGFKV